MTAPGPEVRVTGQLADEEITAVLALAADAARADGANPLSEHVVLHVRHGGGHSRHLLIEEPEGRALLAYAHLDLGEPAEGPAAELAVSPSARRRGLGGLLLDEVVRQTDGYPAGLRLWAHGANTSANELAAAHGFRRVRRLWQLRRALTDPPDPVELPQGFTVRPFDAGRDVEAWLGLNATAFADLPDQGGWSRQDLQRRMAEPWFDPAGFLMAHDAEGRLVGFHWTKVHRHPDQHHEPLGEVYVLGVDPLARGRGLGRALTLAGLHHLRGLGLSEVLLFVDADNAGAIALYRGLGFAAWDSDTLFRR